ncbi:MAG TPA: enoyl-CoA hydratase-related protein, partial [Geodermatophilus sp.]|nr:enoyl-CoA hydratase-related protein [Geodermatophilus sp.]
MSDPTGTTTTATQATATQATVTREDAGGVATVTLQRPALSRAMRRELLAVVRGIADDESVRAVLLTGTGRAFCVGQDLGEHVESLRGDPSSSMSVVEAVYNPLVLALAGLRVPVVVAVNGACAGAGLGL